MISVESAVAGDQTPKAGHVAAWSGVPGVQNGSIPMLPEPSEQLAVLPRVIRTLVQRRRTVKDLLKSERDPVGAHFFLWWLC